MSGEDERGLDEAGLRVSALVPVGDATPGVLSEVRDAIVEQLERQARPFEILFLIDRTHPAFEGLQALWRDDPERIRVLEFEHAVGEAAMLRAGAEAARGELLLTVPAPLEVVPVAIGALCDRIAAGADLALATRIGSASGRAAVAQSRLFNRLISLAAGMRIRDVASATRVLRREVLSEIPLYGEFHRYLPVLAERTGFRVVEVPSAANERLRRAPVHAPTTYLFRLIDILTVLFISRFTRRPLRLFGSLGVLFLALGVPILMVVGVERLLGTPLGSRPILVLGTLLVGLGVQSFTIGLLGELLLFFNAGSFRDYRVSELWEPQTRLPAPTAESRASFASASGAPPRAAPPTSPPRTSGTRSPR
jgi:hypothetical protein